MVFKRSAILLAAVAAAAVASTEAAAPVEVQSSLKHPVVKSATHANGKLTLTLVEDPKKAHHAKKHEEKKTEVKKHETKKHEAKKHEAKKHEEKKTEAKKPVEKKHEEKKEEHKKHHEVKKPANHKQVSETKNGDEVVKKYPHGQVHISAKGASTDEAKPAVKKHAHKKVAKQETTPEPTTAEPTDDDDDDEEEEGSGSTTGAPSVGENEDGTEEEQDFALPVGDSVDITVDGETITLKHFANGSVVMYANGEVEVINAKNIYLDFEIDDDDSSASADGANATVADADPTVGAASAAADTSLVGTIEKDVSSVAKKFSELATKLTGNGMKEAAPIIFIGGAIGALAAVVGIAAIAIGRARSNSAAADPQSVLADATEDVEADVEAAVSEEADVLALPPHKPINESKEKEDLSHYVPSLCFGATEICSIFCSCCGLLIIIPLVLFLPLSYTIDNDNTKLGLRIATIVLCGLGFLYFIYSIRTVFSAGLFCMPPPPPQTGPLLKPFEGEKKSYKLSVRRVAVIYNPYGGTKQGARIFDQIVSKHLKEKNIEIIAYKTEYAGHARDYSKTISLDGIDAIIVIGGDGTFHEAVNGLLKRDDGKIVPIGIVPGGSGNSVMMDFGTWNPKTAIDRIIDGDVCWIDVNHVKDDKDLDIYSINEVSWGIVGDVGVVAEDYRIFGPSRYDICAIWLMLKKILRPIKLKYRIVGGSGAGTGTEWNEVSGEYLTAFINLTQHFGKGLRPAPKAKVDDGLMDLIFLNNADRGALLTIFQQIPKGSHVSNTDIQYIQTTEAIFRPLQDIGVINIDGEIIKYQGSIHISCHHKRLPIFLPPDCKGPSPSFPK